MNLTSVHFLSIICKFLDFLFYVVNVCIIILAAMKCKILKGLRLMLSVLLTSGDSVWDLIA